MMKIGFDAKRLFHNKTGLGHYSRNLVSNLSTFYPKNSYHLYTSKAEKSDYLSDFKHLNISSNNKGISALHRSFGITNHINQDNIDIYHGLSHELPLNAHKIKAKKVVTIHDLFYETYPNDFTIIDRNIYKLKTERACKDADTIIAISEATKQDILKYINVDADKIHVAYQTCNSIYQGEKPSSKPVHLSHLPEAYFMQVGSINHRKNVISIIKALGTIPKENRLPFVIVGTGKKEYTQSLKNLVRELNLDHEIFFLGNQNVESLHWLFSNATFTTLPSFYEGFGIPIIESLFCGTPVLTSNISSMPEALGNNGILVNPNNLDQIRQGIIDLLSNSYTIDTQHLNQFTAQGTTDRIMDIYKS